MGRCGNFLQNNHGSYQLNVDKISAADPAAAAFRNSLECSRAKDSGTYAPKPLLVKAFRALTFAATQNEKGFIG